MVLRAYFSYIVAASIPINSLPHNPRLLMTLKRGLFKTLWEKEKMLVTSIFSFAKNVFYPFKEEFLVLSYICRLEMLSIQTSVKISQTSPCILCLCNLCCLKTLQEKEELLVMSKIPFSPQCFLHLWWKFCHLHHV